MTKTRIHGGPGPNGAARHDFSTTANALGPHPESVTAIGSADHTQYPDPTYRYLRKRLSRLHGVDEERILFAASASEFIFRCTAISGNAAVCVPEHGFGDYTSAAKAYKRSVVTQPDAASLCWYADPSSPQGLASPPPARLPDANTTLCVLDRACDPLRLAGTSCWSEQAAKQVVQLYSPNKALGLTGMRAAYAIAPTHSPWIEPLQAACPSWPLGAASVALLDVWSQAETQQWVAACRPVLQQLKLDLTDLLESAGFSVQSSVSNFALVRAPESLSVATVNQCLTEASIAWRETTSFGLPDAWRVSVQNETSHQVLFDALNALCD